MQRKRSGSLYSVTKGQTVQHYMAIIKEGMHGKPRVHAGGHSAHLLEEASDVELEIVFPSIRYTMEKGVSGTKLET